MTELNAAGKMDREIATILNREGFVATRGCAFKGENVWLLRTRWSIPTEDQRCQSQSNALAGRHLLDSGVAAELKITPQTVFDNLARGLLAGHQLTKGRPWQIDLSDEQINRLRAHVRRTKHSKKEAS